jgi:predicted sulfurtransferase
MIGLNAAGWVLRGSSGRWASTSTLLTKMPVGSGGLYGRYSDLGKQLAKKGSVTAVSFFKFAHLDRERPVTSAEALGHLREGLAALDVKGTLYVADEGYNGAFCVPSKALGDFYLKLFETDRVMFRDLDINVGKTFDPEETELPFRKLVVKQRAAVLTDGLPPDADVLELTNAGPELPPAEWHRELASPNPPLVIDCRNDYESAMGTFTSAVPLNTRTFAESWRVLDTLLAHVDKDQRVLTFCTGGIRCIKVNAYLKQRLGMTNIARLQKGIIHYESWLEEEAEAEGPGGRQSRSSLFKGKNFVFDRRRMVRD